MDIFMTITMALLSLDTIRAVIAMLGWVKPDAKYAWIIYGRYERNLIKTALKDIGFTEEKSKEISKKLHTVSDEVSKSAGVPKEDAAKRLIVLLAKYIVKFEQPIQYGGKKTTKSNYYIDTMEISHNDEDRKVLSAIMVHLFNEKTKPSTKPKVVITPKGGNPLFVMEVAKHYNAVFLMAKADSDKSRISSVKNNVKMDFKVNYEGSWGIKEHSKDKCVVMDCNTSGGSQLLNIVKDIKKVTQSGKVKIKVPDEVYVLFRADEQGLDIDKKFSDCGCSLYRFFDLDEELKGMLYSLQCMCISRKIELDIYYGEVLNEVNKIISKIKEKNKFYFDV